MKLIADNVEKINDFIEHIFQPAWDKRFAEIRKTYHRPSGPYPWNPKFMFEEHHRYVDEINTIIMQDTKWLDSLVKDFDIFYKVLDDGRIVFDVKEIDNDELQAAIKEG